MEWIKEYRPMFVVEGKAEGLAAGFEGGVLLITCQDPKDVDIWWI
jgi:hypothetical protein